MPAARKPRAKKPVQRTLEVLIRPGAGQPALLLRITVDGEVFHYWVDATASDYGRAFLVSRPGHECSGDQDRDAYDVLLDTVDSCTCPGHTYVGRCKHVDALRALDARGALPRRAPGTAA